MPVTVPQKMTHPMAPLVERVAVPIVYVTLGVLIGMYVARRKKTAA